MISDFEIVDGIYIVQGNHTLDLHNNFAFQEVRYSVVDRSASLQWRRRPGSSVTPNTPATVCITFEVVSEFRFGGRDPEMPPTEGDCVSTLGYFVDDPWARGQIVESADPEEGWLTAIGFQSGAVIALRAERASAHIA